MDREKAAEPLEAQAHEPRLRTPEETELLEAALSWAKPEPEPGSATRFLAAVEAQERRMRGAAREKSHLIDDWAKLVRPLFAAFPEEHFPGWRANPLAGVRKTMWRKDRRALLLQGFLR